MKNLLIIYEKYDDERNLMMKLICPHHVDKSLQKIKKLMF